MQKINSINYEPIEITDEVEEFQLMKKILNGRVAAYIPGFINYYNDEETHIKIGNEEIIIFPVKTINFGIPMYENKNAVFKVISNPKIITLKVPKGEAGMIIGTNGWQIKDWTKKVGAKRINVVEVQEI